MINLLPPQEKEKLLLEKTQKLVIVLTNSFIISLICLILILLSLKFYILKELAKKSSVLYDIKEENQAKDFLF